MKILEDVCKTITSGQITSRIEVQHEGETILCMRAIVPKSIENGKIKHDELSQVKLKKEVDSIRITQKGDIVVKLSTPYDSALITSEDEHLIVTSFCAIIRGFEEGYIPAFITAYLNTKYVRELLKASTAGATTPLLKVSELKRLPIPKPAISKQEEIYHAYANNMKKIKILQELIIIGEEMAESIVLSNLEVI